MFRTTPIPCAALGLCFALFIAGRSHAIDQNEQLDSQISIAANAGNSIDTLKSHGSYLSGREWNAALGWVDFGERPINGHHYANLADSDLGVNINASGDLSGVAWSDAGWIDFDVPLASSDEARWDLATGRIIGWAWNSDMGWVGFSNPNGEASPVVLAPSTPLSAVIETCMKNRYLAFQPNNPGVAAFFVQKVTGAGGAGWVGSPDGQGWSKWENGPVFRFWLEPEIYVGDCEVSPGGDIYLISAHDGISFSAPLTVVTAPTPLNGKEWGDLAGALIGGMWSCPNQIANVGDITALLSTINGGPVKLHFSRGDLASVGLSSCVNKVMNVTDLQHLVRAIQGDPYPFIKVPPTCPVCP